MTKSNNIMMTFRLSTPIMFFVLVFRYAQKYHSSCKFEVVEAFVSKSSLHEPRKIPSPTKLFEVKSQNRLDQTVTTKEDVITNSTPRILTVKSTLVIDDKYDGVTSSTIPLVFVRKEWLEFFWSKGGGFFLPPPISYGPILKEGGGTARRNILRIPPLLIDSIIDISKSSNDNFVEEAIIYQIQNPGWMTIPFLIESHLGRVRFLSSASDEIAGGKSNIVNIIWEVEVRPYPIVAPFVEKLLEMTASTIVRNLKVHVEQPNAVVTIKPARGNSFGGKVESLGTVHKDTWLGGVLNAHLSDNRTVWEQTISIFLPWTWGRSGNGGPNDNVQYEWKNGYIER